MYGPVRTVVWEGGGREAPPYPDRSIDRSGVMAELGVPACVLEDQHQFILRHHVQHEGGDKDMIVPFLAEAKRRYPGLASCSMDKGFYTSENREQLDKLLGLNVMPRKGRHRKADRERGDPSGLRGSPASTPGRRVGDQ